MDTVCPSCGVSNSPTNQFCSNCGKPLAHGGQPIPYVPTASSPPPLVAGHAPPTVRGGTRPRTIVVVVLIIVVIVVLAGVGAVLLGRQFAIHFPSPSGSIQITQGRSSDGTNWTLTLTSVPSGLNQTKTFLAIMAGSAGTALPTTALASLSYPVDRVAYVPSQSGTSVAAGDQLLINTMTYPSGDFYEITNTTAVLAVGTLR